MNKRREVARNNDEDRKAKNVHIILLIGFVIYIIAPFICANTNFSDVILIFFVLICSIYIYYSLKLKCYVNCSSNVFIYRLIFVLVSLYTLALYFILISVTLGLFQSNMD